MWSGPEPGPREGRGQQLGAGAHWARPWFWPRCQLVLVGGPRAPSPVKMTKRRDKRALQDQGPKVVTYPVLCTCHPKAKRKERIQPTIAPLRSLPHSTCAAMETRPLKAMLAHTCLPTICPAWATGWAAERPWKSECQTGESGKPVFLVRWHPPECQPREEPGTPAGKLLAEPEVQARTRRAGGSQRTPLAARSDVTNARADLPLLLGKGKDLRSQWPPRSLRSLSRHVIFKHSRAV